MDLLLLDKKDKELLDNVNEEGQKHEKLQMKLTKLPINRVKAIIKTDPDVNMINQEAVFLIAAATELFIDSIVKEAYKHAFQSKKKTIQRHDVDYTIDNIDSLIFLDGT